MKLLRRWWRFRWYGLGCAVLVSVTGWIVLLLVPGTYVTVATVNIPDAWIAQQYREEPASTRSSASANKALDVPALGTNAFGRTARLTGKGGERANILQSIVLHPAPRWRNLYEIRFENPDQQFSYSVVDAFVNDLVDVSKQANPPFTSDQADTGADVFRLLEPSKTGRKQNPYGIPVWLSAVLFLSVLSALLIVSVLNRRRPVFHEPRDVLSGLGVSDVISVSHANVQEVRSRQMRDFILFCGGLTVLLVAYVLVFLV
jgi:hypothetical protein